ncbi:BlaI/MecI/CopY family transcriptional regulator [Blastopirellula marina]|uniref:CopY family transcriptional regulator n=1 Tax=Blastopirellula marina TaxID=124 RepID=A0A2S8G132_9BACT|nr:BlaI/MecI/CopY family transcriptional regulator [Blastopirellula marina]PQO38152.1 CopY family transcriptional regulator [Blastopirellula marina]PTL44808.1 BlaI/MecI/CopY family transcriptional regulator [Blastopirellula marina]
MSRSEKPPLSDLENKVMAIVWKLQEVTADQVRQQLDSEPPLKDSTVRTILRRLEEKGYVSHRLDGRTYVYSPQVRSQSVAADAVRSIIERFCGGSLEALLVGMVDREVVSPETLQQLADKIAEQEKQTKKQDAPPQKPRRKRGA